MARWRGVIGYAEQKETSPGVWVEEIIERSYKGYLIQNSRQLQSSDQLNDNINVSNEISIVADPYANQNFHAIRYAEFMGAKWKISNIRVQHPRLILTIGGLYNVQ